MLIAGIIILLVFLRNINLKTVAVSLKALGVTSIFYLLGLTFLNIVVKAIRWQLLTLKIAEKKVSFGFSFASIIAGVAGGSIMPARLELAKPLMLKTNYDVRLSHSLSALTMERILDLLTFLIIIALTLIYLPTQNIVSNQLIILFLILLVAATSLLALFPRPFITFLQRIISLLHLPEKIRERINEFIAYLIHSFSILKSKLFLLFISVLSFAANAIEIVRFYVLLHFLGVEASFALAGFAFAAAVIIAVITTIPGGIGVTELSLSGILSTFLAGVPLELINSAVLIDRFIAYYLLVLIGCPILILYGKMFKGRKERV